MRALPSGCDHCQHETRGKNPPKQKKITVTKIILFLLLMMMHNHNLMMQKVRPENRTRDLIHPKDESYH